MDDLLIAAGLIAILVLVVMPVMIFIALSRSKRNDRELTQLKKTVLTLQQQLAKWQRGETRSAGSENAASECPCVCIHRPRLCWLFRNRSLWRRQEA